MTGYLNKEGFYSSRGGTGIVIRLVYVEKEGNEFSRHGYYWVFNLWVERKCGGKSVKSLHSISV